MSFRINILDVVDLSRSQKRLSPDELAKMRRENPLQAALHLIHNGEPDEARQLIQAYQENYQNSLRRDVQAALEEAYRAERENLQAEVQHLQQGHQQDQQEISHLRKSLDRLAVPPFSRAVLVAAVRPALEADVEQISELKTAISALESLQGIIDAPALPDVLEMLFAKLQELEKRADDHGTGEASAASAASPGDAATKGEESTGAPASVIPHRAIIAIGSGRHEVNMAVREPWAKLATSQGREVWTAGQEMTVVKVGESYAAGTAAEVVRRFDNDLLLVKGRGDEEYVVEMTPQLAAVEDLEPGDTVRVLPQAELGLDLLEKATKRLALDQLPTETYNDIGGMEEQIAEIRKSIELPFLYRNVYRRYDLRRPKGILLYGPPGCGKTMVAKAIARSLYDQTELALQHLRSLLVLWLALDRATTVAEAMAICEQRLSEKGNGTASPTILLPSDLVIAADMGCEEARVQVGHALDQRQVSLENVDREIHRIESRLAEGAGSYFLSIKGPELLSKWVGEAEYSIRRIFSTAREKATQETPVILFFDEIESMFSRRGSGRSSDMEKTIVPQLLAEIDGVEALPNVLVIGASNRYDLIDPAVLRPGRLDVKIRIDRPDKTAAYDITGKYLTDRLPIDDREIARAGSREQALRELTRRALDVIYNPGSQILIYRRTISGATGVRTQDSLRQRKPLTEVVSGAMLANVVERAKRSAAEREVKGSGNGISWEEDLRPAIKQECEESKDQYIFEARGDGQEMAYLDADLYEAVVILNEETSAGRPLARWARFKKRPWLS